MLVGFQRNPKEAKKEPLQTRGCSKPNMKTGSVATGQLVSIAGAAMHDITGSSPFWAVTAIGSRMLSGRGCFMPIVVPAIP